MSDHVRAGDDVTDRDTPTAPHGRTDDRSTVEAALDAWFLHDWWEDYDVPAAQGTTDKVLALLRSLPVEQRMEAMGMQPVGWTYDNDPSGYFCGGPSNDYPKQHPHVYVDIDVAMRKENLDV